jgi:hypothetical protein
MPHPVPAPAPAPAPAPGPPSDIHQYNPATPKERHSLTLDQRRNLRRWANSQPVRPSHKACIDWFRNQYGQVISQSTVSHSLSPKYSRLDGEHPQLSGSRLRFGNWPDVEKLVLLWYRQVQASGRHPTNEELGEKAKAIFNQLPRYREEQPPEFSPGWIHRFKKRYGLLVKRQRRNVEGAMNPADDIDYLADCVPRFMAIEPDTSPGAIREEIIRVVGVESTLSTCALVRDEIIRRGATHHTISDQSPPPQQAPPPPPAALLQEAPMAPPAPEHTMFAEDDPEMVLQNALRQLQHDELVAEEQAAAVREERERAERVNAGLPPDDLEPTPDPRESADPRYVSPPHDLNQDLTLTPINSDGPSSVHERPIRCPFCINQRMLRTIKEAVEHMSTHVVL